MSIASPPRIAALDGGEHDGITWCIARAPIYGAVNGYVKIPADHPWFGKDYDDIGADVSGGLTYSSGGWIGFDTMHAGDCWPDMPHYCRDGECDCTNWTAEMVAAETRRLAEQVAAVSA